MRNPRKKSQKVSNKEFRKDGLLTVKKVLDPSDGIFPATIVEEKKEPKHKNVGVKLMKKYGINTKKRGVNITRKNRDQSKAARKISAQSRKMNRGK